MARFRRGLGGLIMAASFAFKDQLNDVSLWLFLGVVVFGLALCASPSRR